MPLPRRESAEGRVVCAQNRVGARAQRVEMRDQRARERDAQERGLDRERVLRRLARREGRGVPRHPADPQAPEPVDLGERGGREPALGERGPGPARAPAGVAEGLVAQHAEAARRGQGVQCADVRVVERGTARIVEVREHDQPRARAQRLLDCLGNGTRTRCTAGPLPHRAVEGAHRRAEQPSRRAMRLVARALGQHLVAGREQRRECTGVGFARARREEHAPAGCPDALPDQPLELGLGPVAFGRQLRRVRERERPQIGCRNRAVGEAEAKERSADLAPGDVLDGNAGHRRGRIARRVRGDPR